jgi:hypothetical protein
MNLSITGSVGRIEELFTKPPFTVSMMTPSVVLVAAETSSLPFAGRKHESHEKRTPAGDRGSKAGTLCFCWIEAATTTDNKSATMKA